MMLHDECRPRSWADVVGQDKAIRQIDCLRKRGLSGRAYWISGASGTGKTTIAKLLAAELADEFTTTEIDAETLTAKRIGDFESSFRCKPLGGGSSVVIVNESHGLSKSAIRQLLVTLERIPAHVCWIFTTTSDGQASLFEDCDDTGPLLSRCTLIALARQGLAKPFAMLARRIAEKLFGADAVAADAKFLRAVQDSKNNLRAVLQQVESGELCV